MSLRQELDSIDLAYMELERPVLLLRVPGDSTSAARACFLRDMTELTRMPAVLLPPGYAVEVIGPCRASAPPLELARWADDGGCV